MTKPIKILLCVVGAVSAIVLLVVVALLLFFDINRYKPEVETKLSSALGMQVTIEGKLGLAVLHGLRVTLQNVRVRNNDTEIGRAHV